MGNTINIKGLEKWKVLQALYNAKTTSNKKLPPFYAEIANSVTMSDDEAKSATSTDNFDLYFDYVKAKPIKTDLSGDTIDPHNFDIYRGDGAAKRAIDSLC